MKQKQRRDRQLAVQRYSKGEGLSAIAKSLGYSRRWVYKWVVRYHATEAAEWYEEQSRCPHSNPHQVSSEIGAAVKLARIFTIKVCSAGRRRLPGSWKISAWRLCPACVRSIVLSSEKG